MYLLYIQCNSTDPITHAICYFCLHFWLFLDQWAVILFDSFWKRGRDVLWN